MKRNFIAALFIPAIMAIINPGNLTAGCVAVENDLKLSICAEYQSAKYQIPFIFFQNRAMGYMNGSWVDVHGAGAQRSDPRSGNPADYPTGHGPQGDAIRIYNFF